MNQRVRVWDIVLIAALVAVCFCAWILPRPQGKTAQVSVDGKIVATLPLSEDGVFSLENGMKVVVEKGTVRVTHSTCRDGICEKTGAISKEGQSIFCLPNRISVVISQEEVDAYVG